MSTAVVTGGAGFLGSHLCEYLLERDWRVICLDNLDTGSLENIERLRGEQFDFRYHNCVEFIDVDEPVDVVFHLASPASPVDYLRLPLATLKVGSYGTHNALGLAKFKRARFLIASTSEVYGDPEVHPQREEYWGNVNPVGPRGVYDEAKRYSEAMTMAYHRQQGVDTHIARIFNTYGPRMRQHDGRAIPTFLRQALEGKPITVFGDGSQTRSFCYVDDLIEGLFRLAMSDYHQPVNIGNPDEMTLLELAEKIVQLTGSALGDRVRGPADRRSQGAQARHLAGPRGAGLGAEGVARRGPAAHDREPRPHARAGVGGAVDIEGFLRDLPGLFADFPRSELPLDRSLRPVCEAVEGLSEENNLALLRLAARHLAPGECYVEAGTYLGRSLIGAALGTAGDVHRHRQLLVRRLRSGGAGREHRALRRRRPRAGDPR